MEQLNLSARERAGIATRKTTCPFVGTAVATGELAVFGSADRPLARIKDVEALGDAGGGTLGRRVLRQFALGNHTVIPDSDGAFGLLAPQGYLSLDFAGSQGAHAGHSGIMLGDPTRIDTGRISPDDFYRLAQQADARGQLDVAAVGAFIAENLARDPNARVFPAWHLLGDFCVVSVALLRVLVLGIVMRRQHHHHIHAMQRLTRLAGRGHLVGSAGEFGLLFAFLAHRPVEGGQLPDGKILLSDVELMMVHHTFPSDWANWPKYGRDWVKFTWRLRNAAIRARRRLK